MGKAVDTIASILNKCLFVSPNDGRMDGRTDAGLMGILKAHLVSLWLR